LRKSLDRKPHIIKFMVNISERKPTGRLRLLPENYYNAKGKPASNAAKLGFIFNKAMVFIRVSLAPRDGGEPIILPFEWPSLAPGVRGGTP
jgi:hypothetical protein